MGFRSYVKSAVKDNTNVKGWTSWEAVKENFTVLSSFLKTQQDDADRVAPQYGSFDDMVRQLGLSDAELRSRMRSHFFVAVCCAILGLFALGWGVFLLFKALFFGTLVSFSLSILMFSFAFKEHFSYFRIKHRRLRCTGKEWLSGFFNKKLEIMKK